MTDTTPEMEILFRERLMARSGEERLRMASSMFDSARRMILASLPPGLSPAEQRMRLYERLYGSESPFDER
jgi:hypothetical protein